GQLVPTGWGESAAEGPRGGLVEPALFEEVPRRLGVGGAQLLGVELGGRLVGLDHPGPGAAVALHAATATLIGEAETHAVGEPLDRLHEPQVVDLHQELDDVAALATAEAVEGAVSGAHVERRGLLVV